MKQPCDEGVMLSSVEAAPSIERSSSWILAATILGSSLAFIDGTAVNVALPALQTGLHASVTDVLWVIESYSLFLSALLLVGGSLGDAYGRKRVFLIGVCLFAAASCWCGLASDVRHLILARSLQGIGAALLVPGSLAIISASFPQDERGKAIGTWSGFTAITAAVGPVLGGWLIEHVSWRAVFFINLPIALIVLFLTIYGVPESRDTSLRGKLDIAGASLATLGLGVLVYGLIESSTLSFVNPVVITSIVAGILLLALFLLVERRARNPMLPLSLFKSKNFLGANILTFFLYSALGGALFFVPLNLIQIQGYSATGAGAALLPFILLMFLLSRWSGGLVARYGSRLPLIVGPLIAGVGFALFIRPGVRPESYWTSFFPAVLVLGLGMSVSVAPLTTTVMNSVPENKAGIASGVNNAVSRTAGLLAVAVFGILMFRVFDSSLTARLSNATLPPVLKNSIEAQRNRLGGIQLPETVDKESLETARALIDQSFVAGFRAVMAAAAALAVLSALTALTTIESGKTSTAERRTWP
jgi:EmrB/QacA subfamily drug resistance transporter